jgi:chromosome segregation ATPase
MKDYFPLILGGVSAVTVVIAAFLGAWLGRWNEQARWLREHRLSVYSEWLGAMVENLVEMSRAHDLKRQTSSLRSEAQNIGSEIRKLRSETKDISGALNRLEKLGDDIDRRVALVEEEILDGEKNNRRLTLQRNVLFSRLQILASPTVRTGAFTLQEAARVAKGTDDPIMSKDWHTGVEEFETLIRTELGLK